MSGLASTRALVSVLLTSMFVSLMCTFICALIYECVSSCMSRLMLFPHMYLARVPFMCVLLTCGLFTRELDFARSTCCDVRSWYGLDGHAGDGSSRGRSPFFAWARLPITGRVGPRTRKRSRPRLPSTAAQIWAIGCCTKVRRETNGGGQITKMGPVLWIGSKIEWFGSGPLWGWFAEM